MSAISDIKKIIFRFDSSLYDMCELDDYINMAMSIATRDSINSDMYDTAVAFLTLDMVEEPDTGGAISQALEGVKITYGSDGAGKSKWKKFYESIRDGSNPDGSISYVGV